MKEILTELKERGVFTAVGGPWISVQEDYFGDLVDVMFVGEAEDTWPRFFKNGSKATTAAATSRKKVRHDPRADAAVRPAQDAPLRLGSVQCVAVPSSANSAISS